MGPLYPNGRIASAYIMLELEDDTTIETVIMPGGRHLVECSRDISFHVQRPSRWTVIDRAEPGGLDKITMTISGGDYRSVLRRPGETVTVIEPLEIEG